MHYEEDEPWTSPLSRYGTERRFFRRTQIHRLAVDPADPSSSVGRSGGGRAGDPRFMGVDSVGLVCFPADGAMEEVESSAFLVQVRSSSHGGARWRSAVLRLPPSFPGIP